MESEQLTFVTLITVFSSLLTSINVQTRLVVTLFLIKIIKRANIYVSHNGQLPGEIYDSSVFTYELRI